MQMQLTMAILVAAQVSNSELFVYHHFSAEKTFHWYQHILQVKWQFSLQLFNRLGIYEWEIAEAVYIHCRLHGMQLTWINLIACLL